MRLRRVADNARLWLATPLLPLVAALVVCQYTSAQNFASSITGTVTDPTGSAVIGAKVELKNMGTNDVHDSVSADNGSYQFNNLIPGTYQVDVTAPGFKS